jgi:hypothetical protein
VADSEPSTDGSSFALVRGFFAPRGLSLMGAMWEGRPEGPEVTRPGGWGHHAVQSFASDARPTR